MITYIREIDSPLRILAWGYVGENGLGEFDPTIYEQVVGVESLPLGYTMIESKTLGQQLIDLFLTLPMYAYSPAQKIVIYTMQTNVNAAMAFQDYDTVRYVIESAVLDPADDTFNSVRTQMLAIIP